MPRASLLLALLLLAGGCPSVGAGLSDGGTDGAASAADLAPEPLDPALFDGTLGDDDAFVRRNPDPARIDVAALRALAAEAEQLGSDAFLVALDGTIIAERYFGKKPAAATIQSITKTVVALAV